MSSTLSLLHELSPMHRTIRRFRPLSFLSSFLLVFVWVAGACSRNGSPATRSAAQLSKSATSAELTVGTSTQPPAPTAERTRAAKPEATAFSSDAYPPGTRVG